MIDCEDCGGTGWVIFERPDGVSGAKICTCSKRKNQKSAPGKTPLTSEIAALVVEGLCENLDRAPRTEVGKAIITNGLLSMCGTVEQATWVVQRACELHVSWRTCGLPGLRQTLCSKYAPKDGITVSSTETYPEGVPSEQPLLQVECVPPPLPPGRVASVSASMDAAVQELAKDKRMPSSQEPHPRRR